MKTQNTLPKKYVILPVMLIAGIVATSVFTTATSSVLQSVKHDISRVNTDNESVQEQLHEKTSLTYVSEKINTLGFVKETAQYIKGGTTLAYR